MYFHTINVTSQILKEGSKKKQFIIFKGLSHCKMDQLLKAVWNTFVVIFLCNFLPNLFSRYYISAPSENTRKCYVFLMFLGGRKRKAKTLLIKRLVVHETIQTKHNVSRTDSY